LEEEVGGKLVGKPKCKPKYLNDTSTYMTDAYIFRKHSLRVLKGYINCQFNMYRSGS